MTDSPFHRPGALAHQLAAFERFKDAAHFALFFDPRTRKTGTTLAIFRHRVERGDVDSLVVLSSPACVKWVWPEEARAELPPEFLATMEMLVWESGKTGESRDSKERIFALRDHPGPVLLSMNAQATLRSKKAWKYLEWFIARRRVMLVADESAWAARFSGQTRRLLTLGGWYDRDPSNPGRPTVLVKAILDGTPVDEGPFDIWYPSEFLRKGLLGYSEKAAFEARYSEYEEEPGRRFSMVKKMQGFKDPYDYYPRLKGYRNLDELHDRMMSFGMRVRYEDVTDAPPKQYESLYFEMTDRQQRVYDRLAEEYVAELGARELTVREVLRRMLRLQMVARNYWPPERSGEPCQACDGSGFVLELNEDCPACEGLGSRVVWSSLERIDPDRNPAMEALIERVREARGPFVVWCRFQQDARDVLFNLKVLSDIGIVSPYWGEYQDSANEETYQTFKRGEIDGIVATIAGGPSHGKDLSRAVLMVYFSNDFKSRLRKQTEERAEGILKKFSTSIVDLIAVGTRDADVVAALRSKRDLAALIMGDPRPWLRGD